MPDRIRQEIQEQTFFPWAWPGFPTNDTVTIGLFQGMFERKIALISLNSITAH